MWSLWLQFSALLKGQNSIDWGVHHSNRKISDQLTERGKLIIELHVELTNLRRIWNFLCRNWRISLKIKIKVEIILTSNELKMVALMTLKPRLSFCLNCQLVKSPVTLRLWNWTAMQSLQILYRSVSQFHIRHRRHWGHRQFDCDHKSEFRSVFINSSFYYSQIRNRNDVALRNDCSPLFAL